MPNVKSQNAPGKKPKTKRPRGERIPPDVRQEALRLVHVGVSNLEIAKRLGIAEGSVRYMRRRADAAPEPTPPPLAPEPAPVEDVGDSDDASPEAALSQVDRMIRDLKTLADAAKADGNTTAAAKAMRDAANLMNLRDRLRKAVEQGSGDAVTIPRDQIDAKLEKIYSRMRTLASVEMCPRCGCELRMAAVGAARETTKEAK